MSLQYNFYNLPHIPISKRFIKVSFIVYENHYKLYKLLSHIRCETISQRHCINNIDDRYWEDDITGKAEVETSQMEHDHHFFFGWLANMNHYLNWYEISSACRF